MEIPLSGLVSQVIQTTPSPPQSPDGHGAAVSTCQIQRTVRYHTASYCTKTPLPLFNIQNLLFSEHPGVKYKQTEVTQTFSYMHMITQHT